MNENSQRISCLFPRIYCAITISAPSGSIWAWREYNFPQRLTLQLSEQQDCTVVQSKKTNRTGYWNNERLNLKKMSHEKTYLVAIFECLMGNEEKNRKLHLQCKNATSLAPDSCHHGPVSSLNPISIKAFEKIFTESFSQSSSCSSSF